MTLEIQVLALDRHYNVARVKDELDPPPPKKGHFLNNVSNRLDYEIKETPLFLQYIIFRVSVKGVSDCCLTPTHQFFSYIMAKKVNFQ